MPTIDKYETVPFRDRNNNVIYVGSLVKVKGFLELAKVWKKVLSYVPDANLYVVGTGKLYGNNRMLGNSGIADTEYESQFIPYLLDENGNLLPSVHFMGIMGDEKNDLLLKCKVGVPNPTGISETFGFTAVEMQAMGCLVTTMRCPGYLDTVALNGILYKSTSKLAKSIITLLQQKDNDYQLMYNFIKSRFDYNIIISQWEKLLMDCGNNKMEYLHSLYPLSNPNYHGKRIKEFIRKWKKRIPVLQVVPPVEIFIDMIYRFFNRKFISFSWWCSFFRRYSRKINNKIMFKLHYKQ
jgi:glycosyltransferase involved in cell wall biosynthesis